MYQIAYETPYYDTLENLLRTNQLAVQSNDGLTRALLEKMNHNKDKQLVDKEKSLQLEKAKRDLWMEKNRPYNQSPYLPTEPSGHYNDPAVIAHLNHIAKMQNEMAQQMRESRVDEIYFRYNHNK